MRSSTGLPRTCLFPKAVAVQDVSVVDEFVRVSSRLTGFDPGELQATGMAEGYHDLVVAEVAERRYRRLVVTVLEADGDPPAVDDPHLLDLARAVTHLWYVGVWPGLPQSAEAYVASPRSYAQGLVWKTFHGAPPGTVAPGFGSWARPPRRAMPT
ncbi:hypothetical protein ATK36_0886 [Amycolatopsis sulphurea]|uniref:Uncharacterized protein n=1 Tax=Amycolatopsis sulphurea TaxID=76022 RepID=A0A2A9G381_9PSEU|nr:hypothetical protein ATK36_0886 [Amycolatopsis sulphurea]